MAMKKTRMMCQLELSAVDHPSTKTLTDQLITKTMVLTIVKTKWKKKKSEKTFISAHDGIQFITYSK